ncbi:MAG: lectin like domain-containing protein [Bacillota bacterium]|nr:lectin like domain-containing protein [Bacillota bacterium]
MLLGVFHEHHCADVISQGTSDSGKTITKDYDMSPLDFAHNFYNRKVYKPFSLYGNTAKDKNVGKRNWALNGGNGFISSQAMANWMGPYRSNNEDDWLKLYDDELTLENAIFIPNEEDNDDYVLNVNLVKEAIQKYGAVTTVICWDYYFLAQDEKSYYSYDVSPMDTNHEVTVIGWDDNYSRTKFDEKPDHNGAWIVQNSWGDEMHEGGIFYVSYEDWSMCDAIALNMQPADKYDANFHYDGNSVLNWMKRKVGAETANVYTIPDDGNMHTLEAVGFTTWNDFKASYNVKVYKNVKKVPTSGELAADFNVSTDYPGAYTFNLREKGAAPVKFKTGEKYAIVIKATEVDPYDKNFLMGYEEKGKYGWISFKTTGKKNVCYYRDKASGKWKDLYSKNKSASFRIKGFTTTTPRIDMTGASVTVSQKMNPYTKAAVKPEPVVKFNGKTLVKDQDYSVSYKNNKYPGTATVIVKGIGLYKGSAESTFTIGNMSGFRAADSGSDYIQLSWDQVPKATGYKIYQVTPDGDKQIKTIKKAGTTTFTHQNLEPGTKYQYKIKTYVKVKKKTYNGPLSPVLTQYTNY